MSMEIGFLNCEGKTILALVFQAERLNHIRDIRIGDRKSKRVFCFFEWADANRTRALCVAPSCA